MGEVKHSHCGEGQVGRKERTTWSSEVESSLGKESIKTSISFAQRAIKVAKSWALSSVCCWGVRFPARSKPGNIAGGADCWRIPIALQKLSACWWKGKKEIKTKNENLWNNVRDSEHLILTYGINWILQLCQTVSHFLPLAIYWLFQKLLIRYITNNCEFVDLFITSFQVVI